MIKKVLFLFLIPVLTQAQRVGTNVDRIVAKVDNYYILRSEVETIIQRSKEQDQPVDKCQALESLAVQKLLVAKAEIDSVIVEPDVVENQLDARMGEMIRIYGSEKNIVEQFNKSIESLKSEVRQQVTEQLTAQQMQQTITEGMSVTPAEVKIFMDNIPKDSLPTIPTEVKVAQLVRLAKLTVAQKSELKQRLEDLKLRVEKGESFEELAKEYSEDQGSRTYGGDLGWAKRGQMVPEFEAAAMRLEPNQMSEVVESSFGFHLIQLLEIRGQEYHARHILLRPEYNRLDMTAPTQFLDSLRNFIVTDSVSFSDAVRLHSEDENTKYTGGILQDPSTGSDRMALDLSMEPNLYFTVDTMKVGTVTAPLPYRSADGKTGMRLLYLKDKYAPHQINMKDDYEKIKQFALINKQNTEIDKWFKEAIAEVYIKIDPEYQVCKLFEY
ncbi:peptidylprolyl isomerase [Jiulongibacter sediminis]|uniref:foldase protein PrsA n=1 Tax=Jiulongibacter sediminis TaxID=1605367 RepID=UPI0026F2DE2B|nr:peptidylprolyl isomerase [Jiulongibacter sediminis]